MDFKNSLVTIDEYKQHIKPTMTANQHVESLRQCLARTTKGWIVKRRRFNGYYYEELSNSELFNILSFEIKYEILGKKKKINIFGYINQVEIVSRFQYYDSLELFTSDSNKLSRYVPPIGERDDKWAQRWLEFMRSRVNNPRAFDEEISAHAYRLRYPQTFIEKCFVHYSKEGHTGKSTLAWTLG